MSFPKHRILEISLFVQHSDVEVDVANTLVNTLKHWNALKYKSAINKNIEVKQSTFITSRFMGSYYKTFRRLTLLS